ncbi:MAG: ArnT family glycosyltransferase [Myxococcota bacterium]
MDLRVAAAIALLSAAFLFVGLGSYGVVNGDEAIYHGIAERMVETGDLFELDFRGERRLYDTFMNAPLHYWARAALVATLGSNLFTMRALSALFGVLTVLATAALGTRLAGRRAGVLAAAVQLTTFQFVYLHGARTGELDTIATCLVATAGLLFLRAVEDGRGFLAHHLCVGALALTKLPLVIVPLAAELVWLVLHPQERRHLRRYATTGLALLPLGLAWHVGQAIAWREHLPGVLGAMLGQASGAESPDGPRQGLLGNLRFYAGTLLYGALPWAAAYPFALLSALRPGERGRRLRPALVHVAVVLLLFGLVSTHFPWYVMPAYPFLSIAVGSWLDDLLGGDGRASRAGWGLGFVVAAVAWLGVDPLGTNPFAERALVFPMQWTSHAWLGLPPALAIFVVGGAWAAAWRFAGLSAALRTRLARLAVAGLLLFAALRVAAPLAHLGHRSPLDRVHLRVHRALEAGEPLTYPISLGPGAPPQIARFLFGEEFEIVNRITRSGSELVLRERGDPKVLDRSIGRAGLEWRFEQARRSEAATAD